MRQVRVRQMRMWQMRMWQVRMRQVRVMRCIRVGKLDGREVRLPDLQERNQQDDGREEDVARHRRAEIEPLVALLGKEVAR